MKRTLHILLLVCFFFFFIRCLTRNIEISRLQGYRQLLLLSKDLYSETKKVTGTLDTARWRSFGVEKKSKKSRSINHVHHHQTTTNSMPCCAVACIELYRLGVFPPPPQSIMRCHHRHEMVYIAVKSRAFFLHNST